MLATNTHTHTKSDLVFAQNGEDSIVLILIRLYSVDQALMKLDS